MENVNNTCVFVKNFPTVFKTDDICAFLKHFNADNIDVYKHYTFVKFKHKNEAESAIKRLHQLNVLGCRLHAAYANESLPSTAASTKEENVAEDTDRLNHNYDNLNEYVKKLHSLNHHFNFNQPPLPYLKYKYPKPSRDIIESICVALESVPKFYTQVLHLMNRMNLPTPFSVVKQKNGDYDSQFCDKSQQTDFEGDLTQPLTGWRVVPYDEEDEESEIECDQSDIYRDIIPQLNRLKRKSTINMRNRNKKLRLHAENESKRDDKSGGNKGEPEIFEKTKLNTYKKIVIKVPGEFDSRNVSNSTAAAIEAIAENPTPFPDVKFAVLCNVLAENRLNPEQMKVFPVFKDYNKGMPSNKLYIKNLAKTVTEDDLKQIYGRYCDKNKDIISIKLMQSGRMKGQAFVTFNMPVDYTEDDFEEDLTAVEKNVKLIEKALTETNGYLLKDKPMVVMYGKKQ